MLYCVCVRARWSILFLCACGWLFTRIVADASLVGSGDYFVPKIWDPWNRPLPPSRFNSPKVQNRCAAIAHAIPLVTSQIQGGQAMGASDDCYACCNTKWILDLKSFVTMKNLWHGTFGILLHFLCSFIELFFSIMEI